ncbi:hypothetical protein [Streptomyces sp. NPDC096323]|uniref:hypothetical protein n=1 Tax=Streptomyces sp. NPDC096323 TaxID=3155822 RepID=UPI0033270472
MKTYTTGRSRTGHYRRPGEVMTYCGRHGMAETTTHTSLCRPCVKAEAHDRAAAEAVAAEHAAPLAERERELLASDAVPAAIEAESEQPAAEVMICVHGEDCPQDPQYNDHYQRPAISRAPYSIESYRTYYCGQHGEHYPCPGPARSHDYMTCVVGWRDLAAVHAGDVPPWCYSSADPTAPQYHPTAEGAARITVATEMRYAAELVTEAEATDGTWRGEWIGEQTTTSTPGLFILDREQGALFA